MSWLKIGKVGRARGLRGAFYVSGRDDPFPDNYNPIIIGDKPENGTSATVLNISLISGRSCIRCDISKTRSDAEKLTGQAIWVKESAIKVNDETEYLWSDIEGRKVLSIDGDPIGRIRAIYCSGASDIVVIDDPTRTVELPLISLYFDMSFKNGGNELRLVVESDIFKDLWIDRRQKR